MKIKLLYLLFFVTAFSFAQVALDQKQKFAISPNPAKHKLNITLSNSNEEIKLEVFDVLGKQVYKGMINRLETSASINVTNWKSGVYLVRVSDNKRTHTKRFIKQ